jgi:hypothetical protein
VVSTEAASVPERAKIEPCTNASPREGQVSATAEAISVELGFRGAAPRIGGELRAKVP